MPMPDACRNVAPHNGVVHLSGMPEGAIQGLTSELDKVLSLALLSPGGEDLLCVLEVLLQCFKSLFGVLRGAFAELFIFLLTLLLFVTGLIVIAAVIHLYGAAVPCSAYFALQTKF